jgi:hypothetical protein
VITCHVRYEIDPRADRRVVAYALFTFPSLADSERYRQRFGVDSESTGK